MLDSRRRDATLKLTGFGCAKDVPRRGLLGRCGAPEYVAPEVLENVPHGTVSTGAGGGGGWPKLFRWGEGEGKSCEMNGVTAPAGSPSCQMPDATRRKLWLS